MATLREMTANELQKALENGPLTDDLLVEYFRKQAEGLSRIRKDHDNFRSIPTSWMRGISDVLVKNGKALPAIDNTINPNKARQIVSRTLILAISERLPGAPAPVVTTEK